MAHTEDVDAAEGISAPNVEVIVRIPVSLLASLKHIGSRCDVWLEPLGRAGDVAAEDSPRPTPIEIKSTEAQ